MYACISLLSTHDSYDRLQLVETPCLVCEIKKLVKLNLNEAPLSRVTDGPAEVAEGGETTIPSCAI